MAWPYTKGEITDALVGKFGFVQVDRDHDFYVLTLDGRSAAYTYVSHGGRDRVTPNIAFKMMKEMRLQNLQQFRDAIDCPLTCEAYYGQLRAERETAESHEDEEAGVSQEPKQPLRWVWTISGLSFGYIQDAALYTYDGRNVGRLVGGSEEIYGLDGRYLGDVRNWNALVVAAEKANWTESASEADEPLRPIHPWPDRQPLPIEDDESDFPHPNSL
jgi:hypothetical protein